ncbi:MAG: S9 family peptidase [Planctomycetes bacterium]|nr:S9 family peptidase [Planctomycetota bacterium]
MIRTCCTTASSLLALALCPAPRAQGLTPEHVAKLQYVSDVIDAGNHGVLFTRIVPRLAKDGAGPARRHLYFLARSEMLRAPKLLLDHGRDFAVWGDKVTYIDRVVNGHDEVFAKPLAGGDPVRVTVTPHGVRSYRWSPDFKSIAFTQLDEPSEEQAKARGAGFTQRIHDEDFRHVSLWLWVHGTDRVTRLTRDTTVFDFVWANDNQRLAIAAAPRNLVDDSYMFKRLHVVDRTGRVTKLVDNPGKLGAIAWSPDNTAVAYLSAQDRRDPHAGMLYVVEVASQRVRALTPRLQGMVHEILWDRGLRIKALISIGVRKYLTQIHSLTGIRTNLLRLDGLDIDAFTWGRTWSNRGVTSNSENERGGYVIASTARHPDELFEVTGIGGGTAARITDSNPWLKDVKLGKQEIIRFKARDGVEIEGLLLHPVQYSAGKRFPMVIVAHGGPESHFTEGWNTSYAQWGQMLCARGYFAWYPNYRSSTGYGVEFAKSDHGDLMGGEFRDHLDAIRYFADRGMIDPKRVGIGGGSYGGYTAAWAATKETEHFAAAVSFVPFVDVRTKWLTTDIPWEFFLVHYQERHFHLQSGYLADRSPLTWAAQCKTPLLLLGGTADPRVHPSQPHMLYRAVKFTTTTPVRYVQYPGEGHGNRINTHRYDYAVRTLRWFDHYLDSDHSRTKQLPPHEIDVAPWFEIK